MRKRKNMKNTIINTAVHKSFTAVDVANMSPARTYQSETYPKIFDGKVPLKIKVLENAKPNKWVEVQKEYYAYSDSYGTVSAVLDNLDVAVLRLKDFEVLEWQ
jgi:hypothetical protein